MSSKEPVEKYGVLAVDIEMVKVRHGEDGYEYNWHQEKDLTISIGLCCVGRGGSVFRKLRITASSFFDGKTEDMTWLEYAKEKSWNMVQFNDFWGKDENILVLDELKKSADCETFAEMIKKFNDVLQECEEHFETLSLVTDSIAFDVSVLNQHLAQNGYAVLTHTRSGRYRWWYELDSYRLGAIHLTPEANWKEVSGRSKELIFKNPMFADKYKLPDNGMNHTPEHDSHKMCIEFLQISDYIDSKNQQ
jgi:hypothetical protein